MKSVPRGSRLGSLALGALLALTACASDPQTRSPAMGDNSSAYIVRSGFSVRGERLGMGALIRVRGNRAIRKIDLGITFLIAGRRVEQPPDTLPYCTPTTDCYWGQSFFPERDDFDPGNVDGVEVSVRRDGGTLADPPVIGELETSDREGVTVMPRKQAGTAYLVALRKMTPVFGTSFFVGRGDTRPLHYREKLFPKRKGDDVRAFLYPGAVPRRVYGPAD